MNSMEEIAKRLEAGEPVKVSEYESLQRWATADTVARWLVSRYQFTKKSATLCEALSLFIRSRSYDEAISAAKLNPECEEIKALRIEAEDGARKEKIKKELQVMHDQENYQKMILPENFHPHESYANRGGKTGIYFIGNAYSETDWDLIDDIEEMKRRDDYDEKRNRAIKKR